MKSIDPEKIFKTMIEFTHDGLLLLDSFGIIIQVNPAACSICGFKSADDIKHQPLKFTALFDLYDFNENIVPPEKLPVSRALNGEIITNFKGKGIRKDSGNVWYGLYSAIPIFDEIKDIVGVVLSIKDISNSIQLVKECEKEKENCRSIIACMVEGVVIADPFGTILEMNPAALRLHEFRNSNGAITNILEYQTVFNIYDLDGNLLPLEKWPLLRALHGETFSNVDIIL